jgi:hydrogenase expression/formation protein HypE
MSDNHKILPLGKLRHEYLRKILKEYVYDSDIQDKRIVMGSKIGEDAAVIDIGDKYLVAKTDPITFATDSIGYYVVNINVNDLVCTGATPKWFQSTILLPEKKTNTELIESIFRDIHNTCEKMHITVIGGHTEVTSNLDRPVIVGSLLGEVEKEKLVLTSGAEPGNDIILTKGLFIEGVSIIAREKGEYLRKKGYSKEYINKCKDYLFKPGISVYKEAVLANKNFAIKAMHDPTEGGFVTGIAEMTIASETGVLIDEKSIKILPEPTELSKVFKLDPLNTISSGSLLIAIEKEFTDELIQFLKNNEIYAEKVGEFKSIKEGLKIKNKQGKIKLLKYSEQDEITKIFQD